jgi:hypothetical protein
LGKKGGHHTIKKKWITERVYPKNGLEFGARIPCLKELKKNHWGDDVSIPLPNLHPKFFPLAPR